MRTRTVLRAALLLIAGLLLCPRSLDAQQGPSCVLQFGVWNQSRHFPGDVAVECSWPHTVPFGNWGVESNLGRRRDGQQFEGWHVPPGETTFQWNSCTTQWPYTRPNCTYYNYNNCTEQYTIKLVNSHAGGFDTIPVSCPYDWDGDGYCDSGGCQDLGGYWIGNNWMDLYELDWPDPDDFITRLTFPNVGVALSCTVWSCGFAQSSWYNSYQNYPVSTQLALAVHWASFSDPANYCRGYLGYWNPRYLCS